MVFGHRSLFGALATALTLLSLSTVSAYASVITGFEPPAYSTGLLAGQNGWSVFGPGLVAVENSFAFAGSQAVFVDGGPTASSQTGPFIGDSDGPIVDLSAEIWLSSSSTETAWQFAATGAGLNGYAGGIDIDPTADPDTNNIFAITSTAGLAPVGIFTRNQWNNVEIILNYTSQTSSIVLNGLTLASDLPFCGGNSFCTGSPISNIGADGFFDTFGGVAGSDDDGFIDNYSYASTTPEPSYGILLGLGFAGLAAARRKRLC